MGSKKDWQELERIVRDASIACNPTHKESPVSFDPVPVSPEIEQMATAAIGKEICQLQQRWMRKNGCEKSVVASRLHQQRQAIERLKMLKAEFKKRLVQLQ